MHNLEAKIEKNYKKILKGGGGARLNRTSQN